MEAQASTYVPPAPKGEITEALRLLDKQNLVLAIHDPSYPSAPGEDTGRGSPYARGGLELLRFARELGFNGVQFGPQGQTCRVNQSPYDGTIFSKNVMSIALSALAFDPSFGRILSRPTFNVIVGRNPHQNTNRVQYRYIFEAQRLALREAYGNFAVKYASGDKAVAPLARAFSEFRERNATWLARDALFEALSIEHHGVHWRQWPTFGDARLDQVLWCPPAGAEEACENRKRQVHARYREEIESFEFCQFLVHEQHQRLRQAIAPWGLKLYGDLQIGLSAQDTWALRSLFVRDYLLGAPPSRTNPDGQPWGHAVLDPEQYRMPDGSPGPAVRLVTARLDKMLSEFDGVRIDHPHGLVCPWVYKASEADAVRAVQQGARLFDSPSLMDHPGLAAYAIARPEQLNCDPAVPRYADAWVTELDAQQVDRYSALLEAIMGSARAQGREMSDIVCEVLSTQPYPLARVMQKYGLGRFRVTQKAKLDDPRDVYRSENATAADWIMVGNHDTAPIWLLADKWHGTQMAADQGAYLAARLRPEGDREGFARALADDPRKLVHAKVADIFASPARNVMIFFADLLGLKEVYNAPGVVSEDNWSLRATPTFAREYEDKRARGEALDLPRVLIMAMRQRGDIFARRHAGLIERLEGLQSAWPRF